MPGVRHWKFQRKRRRGDRKVPPPDPARNRAGIVRQRRPPRCRCRTTRRGDPCGRPPPNCATVRRPLPGHYRTGGVERRLSGADWDRRPERRVSRADWDRRPSGRREWRRGAATHRGTMQRRRAPTRGAPTVIGDWSDRAAGNRPSSGRLEFAPPGGVASMGRRPSVSSITRRCHRSGKRILGVRRVCPRSALSGPADFQFECPRVGEGL